jgi:putative FmdB family regulatory protein
MGRKKYMPIYEFTCQTCGNEFERLQSFSDTTTPTCPKCQSVQVDRRLSSPAIHFKGSGWYVTDSKKSSGNGKAASDTEKKAEAAPETKSSDESTDKSAPEKAKPDKKSDAAPSATKEPA